MPFELIRSETLLEGRAFKIQHDAKTPDGGETRYEIIEHGGSVVLIPIDEDGNMLFVRQYRHAAGERFTGVAGWNNAKEGDEPYKACTGKADVREETGLEAGKLQKIGEFYLAPGYSSEYMAVFLATEFRRENHFGCG